MSSNTISKRVSASATEIPFFSARIAAGLLSPASEHVEQIVSLDELLSIRSSGTYLVRAHGDSMIGVGIFDGDVLVVSKALTAVPGDVVIATVGGDAFVKRMSFQSGMVVLCSENARYPPRYVLEGDDFSVWGVVTNSIRRHRIRG